MFPENRSKNFNGNWACRASIKLASNENPFGPSPKALAVLDRGASTLHRYPDGGAFRLRGALADRWKVTPDQVILGNGSDEILGLLARTFLSPGDEAVMADQTFVIYKMEVHGSARRGGRVPQKKWHHDFQRWPLPSPTGRGCCFSVIRTIRPARWSTKAMRSPALIARVPEHVVVVFDEAYFEYVRQPEFPDSMAYVKTGRHAIVLRTFSKIYGLAGLRIGYGMTTPEITELFESNPATLQRQQHGATGRTGGLG